MWTTGTCFVKVRMNLDITLAEITFDYGVVKGCAAYFLMSIYFVNINKKIKWNQGQVTENFIVLNYCLQSLYLFSFPLIKVNFFKMNWFYILKKIKANFCKFSEYFQNLCNFFFSVRLVSRKYETLWTILVSISTLSVLML